MVLLAGLAVDPTAGDRGIGMQGQRQQGQTPARIAPISRTVASGSTVRSVHRQAPRTLSLPPHRGSALGSLPGASVGVPVRRGALVDVGGDARTIGRRLRQIRHVRRKSLRVIAGLAGISEATLSRIENGLRALDRHSEIVALAEALQIAPSELTRLSLPASTNGDADSAEDAVRLALMAVDRRRPGGQVLPVDVLRTRVVALVAAQGRCDRPGEVGARLPTLIRDLYSSIEAGRDVAELLDLAVLLHTQVTVAWLRVLGASSDLRWQAATLAHNAAAEREEPTALGVALWGGLYVMIGAGAFDLALAELDSVTVPTNTPESMQVAGTLALCRSLLAAVDSRPGMWRHRLSRL